MGVGGAYAMDNRLRRQVLQAEGAPAGHSEVASGPCPYQNPGMDRRDFIRASLVLSADLAVGAALRAQTAPWVAAQKPAPVPVTQFRPLRGDVGIFTGRGGTIGWLSSKDALAVVDTQYPDTAAACLAGIPGIGRRTIDATINTHHHVDHTAGNGIFKPASRVLVANENVPRLQAEAAQRAELKPNPRPDPSTLVVNQVYADTTFTDVWRRELGSEIVTAEFRGPAHTGGDAVVVFEKANVVHMGDLVFNRIYPFVDRPGGATIRGWIKSLEDSAAAYPADAIYVFGHGGAKFGVTGGGGTSWSCATFSRRSWSACRGTSRRAATSQPSSAWRTSRASRTSTRRSRTGSGRSLGPPSTN